MDGSRGSIICKVAHTNPSAELFWHLDNHYIGSTTTLHTIEVSPTSGYHTITAVDHLGHRQSLYIIVSQ
jgi:penicillin-binding protein 1C